MEDGILERGEHGREKKRGAPEETDSRSFSFIFVSLREGKVEAKRRKAPLVFAAMV